MAKANSMIGKAAILFGFLMLIYSINFFRSLPQTIELMGTITGLGINTMGILFMMAGGILLLQQRIRKIEKHLNIK